MNQSDLPERFSIPWANGAGAGYIRSIPTASQTPTSTDAPASLTDGFPPETFAAAGAIPPNGMDFNGILNWITETVRWLQAGGPAIYDSTFAGGIGGSPKGAVLASTTITGGLWYNVADGNTANPDTGPTGNWLPVSVVTSKLQNVNGYRVYSDEFKECWGRVIVPANSISTITMPVTHTDFIIPTISAQVVQATNTPNYIGTLPPSLNSFVIVNNGPTDATVSWATRGY